MSSGRTYSKIASLQGECRIAIRIVGTLIRHAVELRDWSFFHFRKNSAAGCPVDAVARIVYTKMVVD